MTLVEEPLVLPDIEEPNPLHVRWVEALESGKYKQCYGKLYFINETGGKRDERFCALGLLLELKGGVRNFPSPTDFAEFAEETGLPVFLCHEVIGWNDGERQTFPEIAAQVRKVLFG